MKKNMRHLQNEHLIKMKLEGADKKKIQKVQQAIDRDTYGVKQCRTTREKYTVNEFINRWANPPFIPRRSVAVYLYLGHNYIFEVETGKKKDDVSLEFQWTDHDDKVWKYKTLQGAEKRMCDYIFDVSN